MTLKEIIIAAVIFHVIIAFWPAILCIGAMYLFGFIKKDEPKE